jgi:O-antigen ligase
MAKKRELAFFDHIYITSLVSSTLAFFLPMSDAANVPKLFLYFVLSILVLGKLVIERKFVSSTFKSAIPLLVYGFFLALTLAIHDNRYLALFGNVGRLTGFINYFGLLLIAVGAGMLKSKQTLLKGLVLTGLVESIYALIQILKIDPISWNNPYGKAIGTLANADFVSAFIGMSSISAVYFFYILTKANRYLYLAIWLFDAVVLMLIGTYQGLVLFIIGLLGYLGLILKQNLRKLAAAIVLLVGSLIGIGAIGIGPAKFLHKLSVELRGDYWRAAIRLINENLFFGIGFGRFQDYYRQYRDYKAVDRRGSQFITDSAHSIYLDLAISGGIILLIAFISLILVILRNNLKAFKLKSTDQTLRIFSLLILIAYLAQGAISMDALGLASWGWSVLGMLLFWDSEIGKTGGKSVNSARIWATLAISFTVAVPFTYKWISSDIASKNLSNWYAEAQANSGKVNSINPVKDLAKVSAGIPTYQNEAGLAYLKLGDLKNGERILSAVITSSPLNYDAHNYLASGYEVHGEYRKAIKERLKLVKLDPLNIENYFQLIKNYKAIGDNKSALNVANNLSNSDYLSKYAKEASALAQK